MAKYLISFPSPAMEVAPEELAEVGEAARAVIREAKAAGQAAAEPRSEPSTRALTTPGRTRTRAAPENTGRLLRSCLPNGQHHPASAAPVR